MPFRIRFPRGAFREAARAAFSAAFLIGAAAIPADAQPPRREPFAPPPVRSPPSGSPSFRGPAIPNPNGERGDPDPFPEPTFGPRRREPAVPEDGRPPSPPLRDRESPPAGESRGLRLRSLPAPDDFTAASLRAFQDELRTRFGSERDIPTHVKAEFLEWVLRRYHVSECGQVHHTVILPDRPGEPPLPQFGDDVATWNGALLAAMSYKYAVTRDPGTLAFLAQLVDGLHFFQQVTGRRGLVARCVMRSETPVLRATRRYVAPDGTVYHYRSDAAKGTYNQVAGGYAVMLMLAGDALPDETQKRARLDLAEMAVHLIDNDYQIEEADGKKTKYGDLRPMIGPISVPFNAQVAYLIIAAAHHFPGGDPIQQKMIRREFERLRDRHHVYYEDPRRTILPPQAVGATPLIKGVNDQNHVHNAAFVGLMLELDAARRQGGPRDRRFLFELGQTMGWTMQELARERNSLCAFMWNGLLRDRECFAAIVPHNQEGAARQAQLVLAEGVEQLRRAPIDRFHHPGKRVDTREAQWLDVQRPDEVYFWKNDAHYRWEITGPPTSLLNCGIDYLHAYWLMRYFRLADVE